MCEFDFFKTSFPKNGLNTYNFIKKKLYPTLINL